MCRFLRSKDLKEKEIRRFLRTSPEEAKRQVADLSEADRREIARYVFPLVYSGNGVIGEAAVMGAYALSHTAIQAQAVRRHLADIFDGLIGRQPELSPDYKEKIQATQRRVDRLYEATRSQLQATASA